MSMCVCVSSVSRQDHSSSASLVCVLLSHGDEGVVYGTDGPENFDKFARYFKGHQCRSLLGKPKLFFIQVSRDRVLSLIYTGLVSRRSKTRSLKSMSVRTPGAV